MAYFIPSLRPTFLAIGLLVPILILASGAPKRRPHYFEVTIAD